ncbi:hypothetical protein D9V29_02795 [Mycetocola manganoxydans]|uniref:Uncharacterized protein n=1 Tax=Mycetocola manganoxydans TaxID=699879 RepID=A0A3L6ZY49_9MICO|nr:hypothetical protein [Mycetocola manganoxydans]RLP72953.1 hypothetical protein D9V29_02795 [Mycetocola manganoxydans]GHD44842.1 hypothetical protein GCM10008097_13330 [Mycetocola manganoxydans]
MFSRARSKIAAVLTVGALAIGALGVASPAAAAPDPLTNLSHLDFLLDEVAPADTAEHTTYRLADEPQLVMPWTYADARDGGTFERVGGGPLDPETGHWGQGAYNADDVTRTAVVYLRHWQQFGDTSSREKAYELLRSVAYLQTATGPNAGNVVLWMQDDGTLNPSAEPVELPDPSDSAESYWLARTLWALGEGYAAFRDVDPEFAAFLQDRLQLSVAAVDRQVLDTYGTYHVVDGVKLPSWLIANGADASAEAVLGLAAYASAAPTDAAARAALSKLAEGIAKMGAGNARTWPYGAILPWAESRTVWHAWGSQMPAALAAASATLSTRSLLGPAITDSAVFDPILLTAGGPDNGWQPTPTDRTQIAYGVDSRLQSLLAVADVAKLPGLDELASLVGSWYFGTNASGEPMYDPDTGVTYDGVSAAGEINRNSGAESTIHGQLSMLALDDHPDVAAQATGVNAVQSRSGLTTVEAETATSTGSVVTPESLWTGESLYSGTGYLELSRGETASFRLPSATAPRIVEPVAFNAENGKARSLWRSGVLPLGVLKHGVGAQGISAVPGALLPQPLAISVPAKHSSVSVTALNRTVSIDALIVRPVVGRLVFTGDAGRTELAHSSSAIPQRVQMNADGGAGTLRSYNAGGKLVASHNISGPATVTVQPGGFAIVTN